MKQPRYSISPFPSGWYRICHSHELPKGKVLPKTFCGEEIVIFRTEQGKISVMDGYCAHMGAHLGHGGSVKGETIRCPFHGFCFNTEGKCSETGYHTTPPDLNIRLWPFQEISGLILVYYDPEGKAPLWSVPELNTEGWDRLSCQEWRLRTHVQDLMENSVDTGHFSVLHGMGTKSKSPLVCEGPRFNMNFEVTRTKKIWGLLDFSVKVDVTFHAYGLGYIVIDTFVTNYGLNLRYVGYNTPIDGEYAITGLDVWMKKLTSSKQIHPTLSLVPVWLLTKLIGKQITKDLVETFSEDIEIWENKRYITPPILAQGDGSISRYRHWCKQFYRTKDELPVKG